MAEGPVFPGFLEHYDSTTQALPLNSVRMLMGGRVRRQEQECGPGAFDQLLGLGTFVEGGIIHDHHMRVVQKGAELDFQPPSEDGRVARSFKQDRGGPAFADPGFREQPILLAKSALTVGPAVTHTFEGEKPFQGG